MAVLVGCGGPARVAAPDWDPSAIAEAAMEMDKDGDGLLDLSELAAAPGLRWGRKYVDQDGDDKLSEDEIQQRMEKYAKRGSGAEQFTLAFFYNKKPLVGAEVVLVPEPILGGVIGNATGTTDGSGRVAPRSDIEGLPARHKATRAGYYRITVTSPTVKLPAKYNDETTTPIGVELSTLDDDEATYGAVHASFNLSS